MQTILVNAHGIAATEDQARRYFRDIIRDHELTAHKRQRPVTLALLAM